MDFHNLLMIFWRNFELSFFFVRKDIVQICLKFGHDFPWTFDPFVNVLAYQLSFFLVSTCKQALSPLFGPAECARRVSVTEEMFYVNRVLKKVLATCC